MNTKNSARLRVFNLAILSALAFNFIYFIHELGLVVAGAWMGNDPVLFHNNMNYPNTSHPSFVLAYAGGPLAVLIVGLLCGGLYYVLRHNKSVFKLVVFWLSYHGLWLFSGQLPEIAFASQGDLARAVSFFQPNQPVRIAGAITGIIGLILLGIFATKPLLATARSEDELATARQRRKLILLCGVLPCLIGSLLIIPFRIPPLHQALLPFFGGLPLIVTLLYAGRALNIRAAKSAMNQKLSWGGVATLVGVFLFFRFVLAGGVPMYNLFYQPEIAQTPSRVYRFVNGNWFNGVTFESRIFYSVEGLLRTEYNGHVDSTIDLQNKFVIPPFADAHNHHFADAMDYRSQINTYLTQGIFYAKNPNNTLKWTAPIRPHLNQRASVDVVYANGGLTASGGHPIQLYGMLAEQSSFQGWARMEMRNEAYFVIDDEKDLAKQWPRIKSGNPDFIKTYLEYSEEYDLRKDDPKYFGQRGLDPELLPKIVALAHQDHLRVAAHVNTAADFHNAIMAGVDEIAHLPLARIDEADALQAAKQGVIVVTTTLSHRPASHVDDLQEMHRYNLHLLQRSSVKLAIGTDNGDLTALNEVENLQRLQVFDNLTLLKIWVENTPQTIFPERKIGHLQDGYEASFLALDGNPLEDFSSASKIGLRFKQGEVLRLSETQRSIADVLRPVIMMAGIDEALAKYRELRSGQSIAYNFAESELNSLGYQLLNHSKVKEAIAMFKLNAESYPDSPNAYDSLADAYRAAGDTLMAIGCYEKVLELLSINSQYSKDFKSRLEKNAREGLKQLK